MSIDWLYASGALFLVLPALALFAKYTDRRRRKRWERREARRGGYVTDDLIRRIRFYDDQADPRELIG